jgi:predicted PurR-regulated permease PerM
VPQPQISDWIFFRRVLIATGVIAMAYIAWKLSALFILFFAAVLIAVLLTGLSRLLARHTFLSRGGALILSSVTVGGLLIGFFAFFGVQISGQVSEVFSRLPGAIDMAGDRLGISHASRHLKEALSANGGSQLISQAASLGYTAVGITADLILVIVTSLYLAADPRLYQTGVVKLFPPGQHERISDAMSVTASALRLWFLGQLVSMLLVGLLCGLAFWAIGLPSPAGLGIIAGVTNFVPLIGPIVGALPAFLFAFTEGLTTMLWTLGAVLVIQQLEGNLITPLIQRRAVDIPPVLILLGLSVFGALAGIIGVILAVPITVVIVVLVQKLWVRETLGEEVAIPGEK